MAPGKQRLAPSRFKIGRHPPGNCALGCRRSRRDSAAVLGVGSGGAAHRGTAATDPTCHQSMRSCSWHDLHPSLQLIIPSPAAGRPPRPSMYGRTSTASPFQPWRSPVCRPVRYALLDGWPRHGQKAARLHCLVSPMGAGAVSTHERDARSMDPLRPPRGFPVSCFGPGVVNGKS